MIVDLRLEEAVSLGNKTLLSLGSPILLQNIMTTNSRDLPNRTTLVREHTFYYNDGSNAKTYVANPIGHAVT